MNTDGLFYNTRGGYTSQIIQYRIRIENNSIYIENFKHT